ncbi:hypothetical protein ACP3TY_12005 [Pseudomonas rustica]|uniref:hypothetical protein n=1 Tax=Pseudomonas rustica TaxID=2827099 RepID=UPI003CF7F8AF
MAAPTLDKPSVPGMKEPVTAPQPVDGAVQLALTQLNPEGVKVFIQPSLSTAADDSLLLRLNGAVADKKIITAGEESQQATLFVPAKLWKDGVNTLEYGFERAGVEHETSHPLLLWFHSKRPGGVDFDPGNEGHSELALEIAQSIRDEGVNADRARDGVNVSVFYPLMRPFDTILLDCNGVVLKHAVNQAEADSGLPLAMTIDEATFIAAGDHRDFPLSYTVYDCAGNGPDTNNPDSAVQHIYVNLTGNWYDPPIVSEDPNDAEDDPDTIDLSKLDGNPATAQVYVPRSWLKDDEIHLRCIFRTAGGGEDALTLIEKIKNTPFMYSIPVPHAHFAAAAGGKAIFHYTRMSGGVLLDRSEALTVSITGSAASELKPPTLVGAGSEIEPLAFPDGVTARVDYPDAQDGDQARLVVEGRPLLGSPVFAPIGFNKNKRANFLLKPAVLAANHGRTVKLYWELLRAGGSQPSVAADVIVQPIAHGHWQLPVPRIAQALGDTLDMGAFIGPAQAVCKPWAAMAAGQLRWFRLIGIDRSCSPYEILIANGAPVTAPEVLVGLDNTLPRAELERFKPGSAVTLELKVSFDGSKDESAAVTYKTIDYKVFDSPATLLEDFTSASPQAVKEGGVMETSNLKFTFQSGDGECAIMQRCDIGESFLGQIEGQVLSIGRDAFGPKPVVVELELKKACSKIGFYHVSVNFGDSFAEYFAADGALLGSQFLGDSYSTPVGVSLAAAGIKFIKITCPTGDWFSLDNIRVEY